MWGHWDQTVINMHLIKGVEAEKTEKEREDEDASKWDVVLDWLFLNGGFLRLAFVMLFNEYITFLCLIVVVYQSHAGSFNKQWLGEMRLRIQQDI